MDQKIPSSMKDDLPAGDAMDIGTPVPVPKFRFDAFASLRNRDFRWYWLGMFASFNAMQMQVVARGWLVYTMTDSPMALGLVTAGFGVPMLLFSLHAGAVTDRVRKRNLMLVTRTATTIISLVITILISLDKIALWHLVVSAVLSGTFMSFYMPGRQAFVMELVGKEGLLNAVAMTSMAMNLCRIGSPALGGVLLKVIGIPGTYWVITISSALVLITLLMIPAGKPIEAKPNTPLLKDVIEGLKYVKDTPIILTLIIVGFVPIIIAMPYQLLMPVFARSIFHAGETGLGLLMSAIGAGALVGSGILAMIGEYQHKGMLILTVGIVFGVFLVFFGLSSSLHMAMFYLVFVGCGSAVFMALNNTLIMTYTPEELIGRVVSINMMTFGMAPLATLPAGALAEVIGAPMTVVFGGAGMVIFLVLVLMFQPRVRQLS